MAPWTAADIPDLDGLTAVVTGANSGLGFQTALELALHNAEVVLACRDPERGAGALQRVRAIAPAAKVELASLDLADLSSIRGFAKTFGDAHDRLDILVNNAGVMAIPHRETADGFEMQFGTNHLGHFALTGLLLPALLAGRNGRVVTVSSLVALIGRINFGDLQHSRRYSKWSAYAQAKLANQLFALELDRRASGLGLISVAAHPGYAATNLQAVGPQMSGSGLGERMVEFGNQIFAQSDAAGALPSLYGATASGVRGGQYFGPNRLFGTRGTPRPVSPVRAARNTETARRLWETSVELTGVDFAELKPSASGT